MLFLQLTQYKVPNIFIHWMKNLRANMPFLQVPQLQTRDTNSSNLKEMPKMCQHHKQPKANIRMEISIYRQRHLSATSQF